MPYIRALKFQLPLIIGDDVIEVQKQLIKLGYTEVGQPDGIFELNTESSVTAFQQSKGLKPDGIVGSITWTSLFEGSGSDQSLEKIRFFIDELKNDHKYMDSISWKLCDQGISVKENIETSGGEPETVRRIWRSYSNHIEEWSGKLGVPAELIIATICTETGGDPNAVREEPGYVSDEETPQKVSPGLMQTLISTARGVLGENTVDRATLLEPGNSILAGTAYIASQWKITHFDPPKVACAYNAGKIKYNQSELNRWKMLQYPINSSAHADRYIKWFNDCFSMCKKDKISPSVSFFKVING